MIILRKILKWTVLSVLGAVLLSCLLRVFVTDKFVVNGISMTPTLKDGQALFVNKMLMGARIYTDFDFRKNELRSFRLPGFRKCAVGDIVVFNHPYALGDDSIRFHINYVLTKRVVGCPGDTIRIVNSHIINSSWPQTGVPVREEIDLKNMPNSVLGDRLSAGQFAGQVWTIRNLGPYVVPSKGMKIQLDSITSRVYESLIRYESGDHSWNPDEAYEFKCNYYFVVGDHLSNSNDSRYFGPIPEDYIIGIVP